MAISFLRDIFFFNFSNLPFQQIIGIPMGSEPAPFIANLILYYFNNKWLLDI